MGSSICERKVIVTDLSKESFQYDLFVIGGGSGGLAAATASASYGAKVGLADFVKPSPHGTAWGLGGTCVNVGCIPKKLFHYASLLGDSIDDLRSAGWPIKLNPSHSWTDLSTNITNYIKSLNFKYNTSLRDSKVTYYNKYARLISKNQVQLKDNQGNVEVISARNILIATGGRPSQPDILGKEHCITSDDIFWKKENPGKTLIVGASYIALECAGFMHGLGLNVTVMVRSIFLRGFDQHMAEKVGDYMENAGIKFIKPAVPISVTLTPQGKKRVAYSEDQEEKSEEFDTVLFAIGRQADTAMLNLNEIGVKVAKNGKIIASDDDRTSIDNIFAIGDVCHGRIELTPTAIMAGKLLAARLFNNSQRRMSYKYVPTTVFTPLQYGSCGFSQQEALSTFGEGIVAYGSSYKPLQWNINEERTQNCYAKIVVNTKDQNRIVGLHFLGPNAGEVVQGFAVAMLKGITKDDLSYSVGIHPTMAQEFTLLKEVAKSAGEQKTSC